MLSRLLSIILFFTLFSATTAQFQFFNGMFGGQQQQHHQQQPAGGSQWASYADNVPCSNYLCQDTMTCVNRPVDCPCPHVHDVKCIVADKQEDGDGTAICVRGGTDCEQVERLAKKFAH
ncbi:hypothetical protein FA95DRAFT_1491541 [Auriscalpium vulgare]|uniref:Uncharacterized protein n=1 Tax=Auriscalpium vulgare TaxID=40419 RepID=A0ACB8RWQ8_9AGAM|nr:hypothetical protein FA95DRAFT_1491541 [Auriscalpium vulgare]